MTIVDRYWDDASEGDECVSPTYTVTKERILAYAELTGDHTPVHVDEDLDSRFRRIQPFLNRETARIKAALREIGKNSERVRIAHQWRERLQNPSVEHLGSAAFRV